MQQSRTNTGRALSVAVAGLVLVATVVAACGAAGGGESASPSPSAPVATPSPIVTPVPTSPASPDPTASPAPSRGPDGSEVPLDVADDHDVIVGVSDPIGLLTGARSGRGRDGMSVRWGEAIVRNLDAETIEVTWAAYARDQVIGLAVAPTDTGILLRFGQEMPYPNTDALGADRVMVFDLAEAISADKVAVEFTTADD